MNVTSILFDARSFVDLLRYEQLFIPIVFYLDSVDVLVYGEINDHY
jgi:hypothetical protein